MPPTQGLPIGNLTSQIFANFYLNAFDHFICNHPAGVGYGRYVDDFVVIHPDKQVLKALRRDICRYLKKQLGLTAHPRKVRLQEAAKGLPFVGFYIKPGRIVCGRRIKRQMFQKICFLNDVTAEPIGKQPTVFSVCQTMNSYLGLLKHAACFRLKRRILGALSFKWRCRMVTVGCTKVCSNAAFDPVRRVRHLVRTARIAVCF